MPNACLPTATKCDIMRRYELGLLKPQLDAMGVQLVAVGLVSFE